MRGPAEGLSRGIPSRPMNPHQALSHLVQLPLFLAVTLAKSSSFLDLHFPPRNTQGGAGYSFLVAAQRQDFNTSVQ